MRDRALGAEEVAVVVCWGGVVGEAEAVGWDDGVDDGCVGDFEGGAVARDGEGVVEVVGVGCVDEDAGADEGEVGEGWGLGGGEGEEEEKWEEGDGEGDHDGREGRMCVKKKGDEE